MPAKHTLHVVLTEPLVRYVRDLVATGHHPTASDVVRASLQAHMERVDARRSVSTMQPADTVVRLG